MKPGILQIISLSIPLLVPFTGSGADTPPTTREQTIRPLAVPPNTLQICASNVPLYKVYGYSAWQLGPGEDEGRQFLTPAESTAATNAARLLLFFSMSDIHITDKESPAEVPYLGWTAGFADDGLGGLNHAAFSPVIFDTTHHLDAAVRTINAMHRENPFDFGMVLGDNCNAAQFNELRWFIDVMDGQYITPSSGAHAGADTIDYQKPFQAAGLDPSIPWYEAIGNHDQMWMGIGYPSEKIQQASVGTNILNISTNGPLLLPGSDGTGMYVGVVDGTTPYGTVIKWGLTNDFAQPPTVVADTNRHTLTTDIAWPRSYVSEFFNTTSLPLGHGFNLASTGSLTACYTFEPMTNLPIKVIVLDDTCKSNLPGQIPTFYGGGWVDAARYTWLTNELQKGQDSNQLMIIATHIPISPQADLFNTNLDSGFYPSPGNQTEANLIATFHNYPNLLLLMAGHRHLNVVTPEPSSDPAHPENGFWEVETASLRDFPRQFRTWEILRNSDNTISVMITDVDPVVEPGSPAAKSLDYAIGAFRLFGDGALDDTTPHTYNAELIKTLSTNMQAVIANYGKPMPTPLVLTVSGHGTVSPDWASTSLREPGSSYTVTATPSTGYSFAGWTGGVSGSNATLTFVMQPGLELQANFAPIPFVATNGTFNGLFYAASGVTHQNSGRITLTTTVNRNFSGKLQIGGGTYSISGQFDLAGTAAKVIIRPHQSPLAVQLIMRGSDWMSGTISNASWVADIIADRAVYNSKTRPAPQAGQYTLVVAGTNGDTTLPQGNGYGTVTVSKAGIISFAGSLADGSRVSQSVSVSQEGQWPLYAALYAGQGSIMSWITFTNAALLGGDLTWTKPITIGTRYPSAFAWLTEANGARYYAPGKGTNVLGTTSSSLTLTLGGGGLTSNITNAFTLNAKNQPTNPSLSNRLTLSFTPSSGLFSGSQIIPGTHKAVSFRGVIVQGQTNGAGYFLGTDQSGSVWLQHP